MAGCVLTVSRLSLGRFGLKVLLCLVLLCPGVLAEKHALLVGINDYATVRDLRGALNDVLLIRELLIKDLGFAEEKIRILTNEEATKANLLSALDSLALETQAGDSILIYYSGHGFMMVDENGDEAFREAGDRYDEVVVPYDAVPWPRERATDPNPTMLSDDEVAHALSGMAGKRIVIVFDSCHSGSATRGVGDSDGRSLYPGLVPSDIPRTRSLIRSQEAMDLGGPTVFMSAASPLQSASDLGEFDGERHGAFTASLLRSIRDSGPGWQRTLSWEGLFRLAKADLLNHGFSGQTPSIQTSGGLAKRPIEEFLNPPASDEIADLDTPEGAFEVQLESRKYRFVEGDLLTLAVESERSGYLYVFDINSEKKITQLFPNRFSPQNEIQANRLTMIPGELEPYQFRAGPPYGESMVVAIVTTQPWQRASQLELPDDFQPITDDQQLGLREQLRFLHDSARSGDSEWASQKMVLEIVSSSEAESPVEEWEAEEVETEEEPAETASLQAPAPPQGVFPGQSSTRSRSCSRGHIGRDRPRCFRSASGPEGDPGLRAQLGGSAGPSQTEARAVPAAQAVGPTLFSRFLAGCQR